MLRCTLHRLIRGFITVWSIATATFAATRGVLLGALTAPFHNRMSEYVIMFLLILGVSLQDLPSLVCHEFGAIIVLLCTGRNSGRLQQKRFWSYESPERITRFTPDIRYDRVVIDLGGDDRCVDSANRLTSALRRAAAGRTPFLIRADVRDCVLFPEFRRFTLP
jgi:hypothetical protein